MISLNINQKHTHTQMSGDIERNDSRLRNKEKKIIASKTKRNIFRGQLKL